MASSRRDYLGLTELAQYADITIVDNTEAYDQISQAEEIIDAYVGYQQKFISFVLEGLISAVSNSTSVTLESYHVNNMQQNFLKGCWIEIVGGTGAGSRDKITAQTYGGVITLETGIVMDTTSYYKIWQLGKFPRTEDGTFDGRHTPNQYYKIIPEAVRRAVAAQVEYMVNMGPAFFGSDKLNLDFERIGDYEYKKAPGTGGENQIIAPKAKTLLRGIFNRTGAIID